MPNPNYPTMAIKEVTGQSPSLMVFKDAANATMSQFNTNGSLWLTSKDTIPLQLVTRAGASEVNFMTHGDGYHAWLAKFSNNAYRFILQSGPYIDFGRNLELSMYDSSNANGRVVQQWRYGQVSIGVPLSLGDATMGQLFIGSSQLTATDTYMTVGLADKTLYLDGSTVSIRDATYSAVATFNATSIAFAKPLVVSRVTTQAGGSTGAPVRQLVLAYNNTLNYAHEIRSEHNAAATAGNAIHFVLWKNGDANGGPPSNNVLSLDGAAITARVPVALSADPTTALGAATKQYVDSRIVAVTTANWPPAAPVSGVLYVKVA
jgi:hypothetical protein